MLPSSCFYFLACHKQKTELILCKNLEADRRIAGRNSSLLLSINTNEFWLDKNRRIENEKFRCLSHLYSFGSHLVDLRYKSPKKRRQVNLLCFFHHSANDFCQKLRKKCFTTPLKLYGKSPALTNPFIQNWRCHFLYLSNDNTNMKYF